MKWLDLSKIKSDQRGLTIVETFVMLVIFVTLVSLSAFAGTLLSKQMRVNSADIALADILITAARRAQAGEANSNWGLYIPYDPVERTTDEIIVFAGQSYTTRDQSKDTPYAYPSGVEFISADFSGEDTPTGNDTEIVFQSRTGSTAQYGSVEIEIFGETRQVVITPQGFITRELSYE